MPGMNGVETVQAIYEGSKEKKTPSIFITGYADDEIKQKAGKLLPVAYIYKPFDIPQLVDEIKKVLK
jgi:CheY-like chemotaxis protein